MRFFLLAVVITIMPVSVFSQDDRIVFNWNFADFAYGRNFPLDNVHNKETSLPFLNIGIEDRGTNLGIRFNPITNFNWKVEKEDDVVFESAAISLANFHFYWSILNPIFADVINFYLGPFTSINYLFIEEELMLNKFIFTAGIHTGIRLNFKRVNYNIFSFELGYRNIDGSSKYYIGGRIDLGVMILLIVAIAAAAANSDS